MPPNWDGSDNDPPQYRSPLKARYVSRGISYKEFYGNEIDGFTVNEGTALANSTRQVVESHGHPYHLLGRVDHDIGGNFLSLKAEVVGGMDFSLDRTYGGSPDHHTGWEGTLFASSDATSLLSAAQRTANQELSFLTGKVPATSSAKMLSDGATAINRCAPTNPNVDLSTSFAELLREGLPSLPGRAGNAGGEYLNYQFGIAPLVSDIRDLRKVLAEADALWAQYQKDSGKHIRRSYGLPGSSSSTTTYRSSASPSVVPVLHPDGTQQSIGPSGALVQPGTRTQTVSTSTKTWFNGAFTYYLPELGWAREMERLDRLYGLKPGVDTLYQLTPWSWLVDYFTNLGDVIENLNAFTSDGLVMPYAYVMSETKTVTTTSLDFRVWNGSVFEPKRLIDTVTTTSKKRLGASPFGFGLLGKDLTPKQWSILAALGHARM